MDNRRAALAPASPQLVQSRRQTSLPPFCNCSGSERPTTMTFPQQREGSGIVVKRPTTQTVQSTNIGSATELTELAALSARSNPRCKGYFRLQACLSAARRVKTLNDCYLGPIIGLRNRPLLTPTSFAMRSFNSLFIRRIVSRFFSGSKARLWISSGSL